MVERKSSPAELRTHSGPHRRRSGLAFALISVFAHGSLLAMLNLIPCSHGVVSEYDEGSEDDYVIQLNVRARSTLTLAQAEPEPPPPAPPAPPLAQAEPEPRTLPEIEPEPSPEPVAPVVTTTSDEAVASAESEPTSVPLPPARLAPVTQAAPTLAQAALRGPSGPPLHAAPAAPAESGPSTAKAQDGPASGADEDDLGDALRVLRSDKPSYPEDARRRNEEGTVTCRLTIERDGSVSEVEVLLSSGSRALDQMAVRTLKRWRFEPLARLTDRERVHAVQKLSFRLKVARS
ncbi:MAG: energy transducer TonB [Planctomycetes bacterium]|nr:energy transducer TonB [Planctomycetota bacterium]